jgi:regulator of sirC expression with transglutaminase-like and TPR domain
MAYYYRGLAYDKLGRKDLMVLDLDRFVKLAPGAPESERARAVLAGASR